MASSAPPRSKTATAIYLLTDLSSSSSFQTVLARLQQTYNSTTSGGWGLRHQLFRSLPLSQADKGPQRYQHVLQLWHHPYNAFVHISASPSPNTGAGPPPNVAGGTNSAAKTPLDGSATIQIPQRQMDPFVRLLQSKFSGLWVWRAGIHVPTGITLQVGDLVVRMGELRSQGVVRGVVICVQSRKDIMEEGVTVDEDQQVNDDMLEEIKLFWEGIDVKGAKEWFCVTGGKEGGEEEGSEEARIWCEALRLKG